MRERRYDLSVRIARPPQVVWDFVTDLEKTPRWRSTITTIRPPDRLALGERFSGTTHLLGRDWHWVLEVTALDPGRHFAYTVIEGVARPTVEYLVEQDPAGCRFTVSGHIGEMGLRARLLEPFALPALRRETVLHLDNLTRLLEAPTQGTTG